jgi:glycine amidinotransferase/scyllo-inosamine-4-phosphate amidinotransferase 1
MIINSRNEWDKLRSIVVGTAIGANWPSDDPVFSKESEKTSWTETPVPSGPVPSWIVDEAENELNGLADILTENGVEVVRPTERNFVETNGMYNYCPRDRLLIAGNTIVDCSMMYPCRDQEIETLQMVTEGNRVLRMPRDGYVCDAANICRLGDTWLFLESFSGNRQAAIWLQAQFPDVQIEICNFYNGVHIDSTIVPLRDGLVMINGGRVKPDLLPAVFNTWDIIWVDDCVAQPFHEYPYASKWIGMNALVIDPQTVIMDSAQVDLIRTVESYGITVIPHKLTHSRTLGGGFHCVTLDLHREA